MTFGIDFLSKFLRKMVPKWTPNLLKSNLSLSSSLNFAFFSIFVFSFSENNDTLEHSKSFEKTIVLYVFAHSALSNL